VCILCCTRAHHLQSHTMRANLFCVVGVRGSSFAFGNGINNTTTQALSLRHYRTAVIKTTRPARVKNNDNNNNSNNSNSNTNASAVSSSKARARKPKQLTPEAKREYQRSYYRNHREQLIERNRNNRQSKARLESAGVYAAKVLLCRLYCYCYCYCCVVILI
jgi:hypothetical protein